MPPFVKIRTPDPGPILPAAPEAVPYTVPRMSNPANFPKAVPAAVWRVTEVELEGIASWLIPSLRKTWPNLSENGFMSWLRFSLSDKLTIFARTKNMVGLATAHYDVMDSLPVVTERFVRSREKANEEAALLYRYIEDWAASISAFEFRYGHDTDASMGDVTRAMFDPKRGFTAEKRSVYAAILRE